MPAMVLRLVTSGVFLRLVRVNLIQTPWWTGLYPGLAIVLLVTGLTLVGEGLNDTLNPVLRRPDAAGHVSCTRTSCSHAGRSPTGRRRHSLTR